MMSDLLVRHVCISLLEKRKSTVLFKEKIYDVLECVYS